MLDRLKTKKGHAETPKVMRYVCNGKNFETSYSAECYAVKEVWKTTQTTGLVVYEDGEGVHATVCLTRGGATIVYYNGSTVQYKDLLILHDSEGKEVATIALCRGCIVRLDSVEF